MIRTVILAATLAALFPTLGNSQTTYVEATRRDNGLHVAQATMPESLWTNTLFWLTADSPVVNADATNATWLCYAKNCIGDATQPVLTNQPTKVYTNGAWASSFDGVSDLLLAPSYAGLSGTNSWTVAMWVNIKSWPNTYKYVSGVMTTNQYSWIMQFRGTVEYPDRLATLFSLNGTTLQIKTNGPPKSVLTNGWTHVALIMSNGRYVQYVADGYPYSVEDLGSTCFASSASFSIGGTTTSVLPEKAAVNIADLVVFNRALSTNEVVEIFNNQRSKYGK
jgi:hypothetical protein